MTEVQLANNFLGEREIITKAGMPATVIEAANESRLYTVVSRWETILTELMVS